MFHALVIGLLFAAAFTLALLLGGRRLYTRMGGTGAALETAMQYSNWVFAGALLVYCAVGTLVLVAYMRSGRSLLRIEWAHCALRWPLFSDILRVGIIGAVSTVATNVCIAIATALSGAFGPAAIAGYGTASRLEYLLVPLVFGVGAPLVAMVGTCMGAGQRERAKRATWIGARMAFVLSEVIGLSAALFPAAWLSLFDSDPAMIAAGSRYLQIVGPFYGFFGLGLVLYFASQGAGRLLWPEIGNSARLVVAAVGGALALQWSGDLGIVFAAQAAAMVMYGVANAYAIAGVLGLGDRGGRGCLGLGLGLRRVQVICFWWGGRNGLGSNSISNSEVKVKARQ